MNCPNPDLLSAFLDGEVHSPWSQRIQEHIDGCRRCRQTVAKMQSLRQLLHTDREPPAEPSIERVRERLKAREPLRLWHRPSLWRSRISVPLPAVAAVFLVLLGMGGLLVFLGTRPNFPFMSIRQQPSGVTEVQVAAPIEDLEQLLKSLDQEPMNQQIIFTLPEDTEFLQFSEPKMLRAEEYSRRLR